MAAQRIETTCCIAGGGPAGMMLGLILARAGVDVTVLEKHDDFLRDFRGDTIHPSTLDLIDQLGMRAKFDAVPHTMVRTLDIVVKGVRATPADFDRIRDGNNRLALMPQWDFLDMLAEAGREIPNFHLLLGAEATGLTRDGERVTGLTVTARTGELEIAADLTVAADGRDSRLRDASGLKPNDFGPPVDVLWLRLPRPAVNPPDTIAYVDERRTMITIPREGYFQTAVLVRKGSFPEVQAAGIPALRASIAKTVPPLATTVDSLTDWDQVKVLSVQINRLERWHLPGFLAIGDAAHAMSPAFGVGINYAVQDAVAVANALAGPLRNRAVTEEMLAAVQERRAPPTARMQQLQLRFHAVIARPGGGASLPPAWVLRIMLPLLTPILRRVSARVIGRGFLPERIRDDL